MKTAFRMTTAAAAALALAAALPAWGAGKQEKAGGPAPTVRVMIRDAVSAQRTASKLDEQKNPYSDFLFAKTGIRVILDRQAGESSTYNDKVTLAFASGDAPDMVAMGGNDQFCMNIVRSGALEPLNDVFGKFANLTRVYDAEYWKEYSFDNKKLVLKGVDITPLSKRAVLIRQDWLTRLNLKMPETVAELREAARRFVDARPDGQPVFGQTGRKNFSYFYVLSSAFGCPSADPQLGYYYIDKARKKLVFWNTTEAARAYFKEALRWTRENLLDPELLTASGGAFWDTINAGKVGIVCHQAESAGWVTTSIRQAQKKKDPLMAVLPALKGTGFLNPFGKEGGFEENRAFEGYYGIPRGSKNVANVLKLMDYQCSADFAEYRVYGMEGIEHKVDNGKKVLDKANISKVSFWSEYFFTVDRAAIPATAQQSILVDMSGGGDTSNNFLYDTAADALNRTKAAYAATAAQAGPRQIFLTSIPKLPVESQFPDILGPYLSLYVKLITGEWDASKDADWQAYLKGVESSGINAILQAREGYLLKNSPYLFQ